MKRLVILLSLTFILFAGCRKPFQSTAPSLSDSEESLSNSHMKVEEEARSIDEPKVSASPSYVVNEHIINKKVRITDILDGKLIYKFTAPNGSVETGYMDYDGNILEKFEIPFEFFHENGTGYFQEYGFDKSGRKVEKGLYTTIDYGKTYKYFDVDDFPYRVKESNENALFVVGIGDIYVEAVIDYNGERITDNPYLGFNFSVVIDNNPPHTWPYILWNVDNTVGYANAEYFFTDYEGNEIVRLRSYSIPMLSDNTIVCVNGEKLYSAINMKGETIIDYQYDYLGRQSEGLLVFKEYGFSGYMDYKGNRIIEPQFDYAGPYKNGVAYVKKDDVFQFIDKSSTTLFEISDSELIGRDYEVNNDGLILFNPSGSASKCCLFDSTGSIIFSSMLATNVNFNDNILTAIWDDKVHVFEILFD